MSTADEPDHEQSAYRRGALFVRCVVGGGLMGLANLVPGVSGGTMLLAAGVYPQFIDGVAEVSTFRLKPRSILVLACIVGGALVAILGLAGVVGGLVVHHRWIMYSLFIGLTLGGVPILWSMVKPVNVTVFVAAAVALVAMSVLALVDPPSGAAGGRSGYAMLFVAGLAGASAMVLPGISGGYLLLLLGQYVAILTAVDGLKDGLAARDGAMIADVMHTVVPVGLGVVTGVVGVSNLVRTLLHRAEKATLGALLGLLLGAVIGLWPFQMGVPPEAGTFLHGERVVVEDGGALVLETSRRPVEPEDYATQTFTPSAGQAGGALALIIAGFAASAGIAHIGGGGRVPQKDPRI